MDGLVIGFAIEAQHNRYKLGILLSLLICLINHELS